MSVERLIGFSGIRTFSTEFEGYLYVATMASKASELISGSQKMGGDIWRTADGSTWEQIGTAGLGDPLNIMFDLVVFKDRLYAVSVDSGGEGMEIWATTDGREFSQLEKGGFGDADNHAAVPMVLDGRLILAVQNSETGLQIWVSEDGGSFRQVSVDGLCVPGNIGVIRCSHPEYPGPVLGGEVYVGVLNSTAGGEIWSTADGLGWERVAHGGLGAAERFSLHPWLVYEERVYVVGGYSAYQAGFDLLRSADGAHWEQVIEDGFGAGKHRNMGADLTEFQGRLYLSTTNEEPRLLVPGNSTERFAPEGFQVWTSEDGTDWTQVGKDGFGRNTSFMGDVSAYGENLYLQAVDYRAGSQLLKSADGQEWKMIFHEPPRSFFHFGPGLHVFNGHCLYVSHDLKKGVDIWRSDEAIAAPPSTTISSAETTVVTVVAGGQTGGGVGTEPHGEGGPVVAGEGQSQRLSGGILALIIGLAVVAVGASGAFLYLLGRSRAGNGAVLTPPAAAPPPHPPGFCSECGSSLSVGSQYCPGCGKKL